LCGSIARLISAKSKYPNGMPVACTIAERAISGVTESQMCDAQFRRENVGVSLSVAVSWCYAGETMELDPLIPTAAIGMNNPDGSGAVYLAALMAAHNQRGIPCFAIYGSDVQEMTETELTQDNEEKLLRFIRAAIAVAYMRGKTYLSIGSVCMGIAGSMVNDEFFYKYLGMRTQWVDMTEIDRRMKKKIYDPEEYESAMHWVRKHCRPGPDFNPAETRIPDEEKERSWEDSVVMGLIVRDMMVGNKKLAGLGFREESVGYNALAGGFQGQRHWTDYKPVGDFHEALLSSSFDWTGIRQPYAFATENDSLNAVAMMFGNLLTGSAQVFCDVRTFWSSNSIFKISGKRLEGRGKDGVIHLINSGPAALDGTGRQTMDGKPVMKPFWDVTEQDAEACLAATRWCPAETLSFCGQGFHTNFATKGEMPITLVRINLVKGIGPVLQLAEGHAIDLPEEVHKAIDERTSPAWPTTWFVPRTTGRGAFRDVYTVMSKWGSNHGSFSYGHIGADIITMASILRIPVFMHNVPEEDIFRPTAWDSFGTDCLEPADAKACALYGPRYNHL
jgi:L-fucose isomerase